MSFSSRNLRSCALFAMMSVAGLASAQSFDPSQLSASQLEKLSAGMATGGQGKARPVAEPVSAPVKPAANAVIPGFSAELRPFGEALFSGGVVPFSAATDLPVPLDYVIGPGDVVELRLFGKENKSYQLTVDRSGSVNLPEIGPLVVAGMSFESVGKAVLERINRQKIGVEATVSMGALRSIQVFLMGDVNNPGAYATDALTTVVNALLVGGGIKPTGSMRKVEIRRQGRVVAHLDLYDAMLHGGDRGNMRLQSGDIIFVPAVGRRVGVSGDVLRPAIYELLNEKTAADVIRLAGGMLPTAYPAQASIDRIGANGRRQVQDVSLAGTAPQRLAVNDGDVIKLPSVVARWDTSVALSGRVERAGNYEWRQGLGLGDILRSPEQLGRDAYRALAIVERTDTATGVRRFQSVSLKDIFDKKVVFELQPEDRVIVLGMDEIEFLSSANVQFVLAGRKPPEERNGLAVVHDAEAELKGLVDANRQVELGLDTKKLPAAMSKPKDAVSVVNACAGLVELSNLVNQEGQSRFRSAVLQTNTANDKERLLKTQSCPALYNEVAGLLPYVLENSVAVRGEVKRPGVLPVPAGMSLEMVINARGGLTRESDLNGIELTGMLATEGRASLSRQMLATSQLAQTTVAPGNSVFVRKRFNDLESGLVRLGGEFVHPGNYEIRRGEKLSDLVTRAGNLTQQAYPLGAVFQRSKIKDEKKEYYRKSAMELQNGLLLSLTRQRASATQGADASAATVVAGLAKQLNEIDPVGRMVVEADPTVLQVRPELDVVLEAGDELFVPRRPSSIMVMGEVLNPGAVQFQAGKTVSDYVSAVGGLTRVADEDRIFAILPNGNAEPLQLSSWNFRPTRLPPGSVIYVSREPMPTLPTDLMLLALQVVKDLALAAASLSVISK